MNPGGDRVVRREGARGRPAWCGRLVVVLVVLSAVLGGVAVEAGVVAAAALPAGSTADERASTSGSGDPDAGADGGTDAALDGSTAGVDERPQVDVDVTTLPGSGTPADPYRISNASELQAMADDPDAHYVLVGDVDAAGTGRWNDARGFVPVGTASGPFEGSFDGAGYEVGGLTITRFEASAVGLFGVVGDRGTVSDAHLTDALVLGGTEVGGLVGVNRGTVERSSADGVVTGGSLVGGLVGRNAGTVVESTADGAVTGTDHSDGFGRDVGGLVGRNDAGGRVEWSTASATVVGEGVVGGLVGRNGDGGTVVESDATPTVVSEGTAGGLVGVNRGTVRASSATAVVWSDDFAGGLVGVNLGAVVDSTATARVVGDDFVGGLVGSTAGTVDDSEATGSVVGGDAVGGLAGIVNGAELGPGTVNRSAATVTVSGDRRVGGLAGRSFLGSVAASYATGTVSGERAVGGLVGETSGGAVVESYAASVVTGAENGTVGGLIGADDGRVRTVRDAYWDTSRSGHSASAGGTGLTTAEMTGAAVLETMPGLSVPADWRLTEAYPVLARQATAPFLAVAVTGTNAPVDPGDTLRVTATVSNLGGAPANGTVTLTDVGFGGRVRDAATPRLAPGESVSVTLSWTTRADNRGTGAVTVASANDSDAVDVTIGDPPRAVTTLVNVTLAGAPTGLSRYEVSVSAPGHAVENVTPVLVTGSAFVVLDGGVGADGVTVRATDDAGVVEPFADVRTLFAVEFAGEVNASAVVSTVHELVDDDGNAMNASLVGLAVTGPAGSPFDGPLPGSGARGPPADHDGDGLYEDVNGDGASDLDDVFDLAFADHASINAAPARRRALDFDGNGVVDVDDAFELAFP